MKPEAQRIAIAEACGFKWFPVPFNGKQLALGLTQEDANQVRLGGWIWDRTPNYPSDLNSMHEAEKVLTISQLPAYFHFLANKVSAMSDPIGFDWIRIHATAAHRAEAFLRTIGKWSEPQVETQGGDGSDDDPPKNEA